MNQAELQDQVHALLLRLERIERHLGLEAPAEPAAGQWEPPPSTSVPQRAAPPAPTAAPEPPPTVGVPEPHEPLPPLPPAVAPPRDVSLSRPLHAADDRPRPEPAPEPAGPRPMPASPAASRVALELLIGERWMAWVGAIVVVLAVGFFVKLAYDLGWWGRMPPLAKCLAAAAFGAALCAGGELALRRVGRTAAVSLFGAGLGTLYLTAYATFRYFQLVSQPQAFWLMLLVALLGFGITVRGRLVAIGVLALLGGYLSPVLLAEQVTFAAALPLYISMLLTVALGLSAAFPAQFRPLRYVGLALHVAVATLWAWLEGSGHWLLTLSFATAWWGLVIAETSRAAGRRESPRGNPVAALLFTFWYVILGCGILAAANPGERNWLGLFTGAVAAVSAWFALALGGLALLRARPQRALDTYAVALWAQVGLLVAAAFAVQFRGEHDAHGASIGWLVMGVACIELGRRLPSRGVDLFGFAVGALGLARVWALDHRSPALQSVVLSLPDLTLNLWGLLALGSVAALVFAGRRTVRLRASGSGLRLAQVLTFAASLGWLIAWATQAHGLVLTGAWLLGVGALLAAAPYGPSPAYRPAAGGLLVVAALKCLLVDEFAGRFAPSWTQHQPFANWTTLVGLLIAAGFAWRYRSAVRAARSTVAAQSSSGSLAASGPVRTQAWLVLGVLFLLTLFSFEIDRWLSRAPAATAGRDATQLRLLWWSLLWATGGCATVIGADRLCLGALRTSGWALLLGACTAWACGAELYYRFERAPASVPPLLNLEFSIGLGLSALVTSAALATYGRNTRRLRGLVDAGQDAMLGAAILLLLALSLEVDRAITFRPAGTPFVWSAAQARCLWLVLLWIGGSVALVLLGRGVRLARVLATGQALLVAAAMAWLLAGVLYWRFAHPITVTTAVLNLQFLAGGAGLAAFMVSIWRAPRDPAAAHDPAAAQWRVVAWTASAVLGFALGTLELDRYFAPEARRVHDPAMACQTAFSIYWGLYGIALVVIGFWRRAAVTRYAGLALLGLTLAKVLLVDLARVQYVYRVLSLLGVGLLLIATSVAYSRLASRLLGAEAPSRDPQPGQRTVGRESEP